MDTEVLKIMAMVMGATGFWRLVGWLLRSASERKVKDAQADKLSVQALKQIVDNWIQWLQTLEKRVESSEQRAGTMQRELIRYLEEKVSEMEAKNTELIKQLEILKTRTNERERK